MSGKPSLAGGLRRGYFGVLPLPCGKWLSAIQHNGVSRTLGRFADPMLAAQAYDKAAVDLRGPNTRLNFPITPSLPDGSASIQLTHGMFAIVDVADLPDLGAFMWTAKKSQGGTWYAKRRLPDNTTETMHARLAGAAGLVVDHKNGNGLDNRRENIRACTHPQNMRNQHRKKFGPSGFKGVCRSQKGRWRAYIVLNYKQAGLGSFDSPYDAALAYDACARAIHGEFACPNNVHGPVRPGQVLTEETIEAIRARLAP